MGLACADPGARAPIGASGNYFSLSAFSFFLLKLFLNPDQLVGVSTPLQLCLVRWGCLKKISLLEEISHNLQLINGDVVLQALTLKEVCLLSF